MTETHTPCWLAPVPPVLALGLLCSLVPNTALAQDQALPKADEVLSKYIEVTGGAEAYEALQTRKVTGSIEFAGAGLRGELVLYQQAPDKMKSTLELENVGTFIQGSDGTTVYEINPISGERILEGAERAAFLREAAINADLRWQEFYESAETTGVEEVDGTPCYIVRMTPKEGQPETRYYAVESGLLIKTNRTVESPMGAVPVESFVSDYREVDGIKIPFKSTELLIGQEVETRINSVEHGVEIPEGTFEVPKTLP